MENKIVNLIKDRLIKKHGIDIGQHNDLRNEISIDNSVFEGHSSRFTVVLSFGMGRCSLSLCGGNSILIEPICRKLDSITEEQLPEFSDRLARAFHELAIRGNALVKEVK